MFGTQQTTSLYSQRNDWWWAREYNLPAELGLQRTLMMSFVLNACTGVTHGQLTPPIYITEY